MVPSASAASSKEGYPGRYTRATRDVVSSETVSSEPGVKRQPTKPLIVEWLKRLFNRRGEA